MMPIDLVQMRVLMRKSFLLFAQRCYMELNGNSQLVPNWHLELMASKLQDVVEGRIKRLIINIPPRHLKSLMGSIALPAFFLGHHPSAGIICATYGQDLSDKFARDCRVIMLGRWYIDLFRTRLASARPSAQELITTGRGFRLATSVGGVVTGRGADLIIIDDPLKPSDADSDSRRTAVNEWYDSTLYSRLNNKTTGAIVVIMQRLHEDDLVGHLLRQDGWEVLSFPAIAEVDEIHTIRNLTGTKTVIRRTGEALHPERENLAVLEEIRSTLGTYHFAGQYQQTPAPTGGGLVREAWFKSYRPDEVPTSFDQIIQSWDTANKPTELADYSVCTTWGLKGPKFYLLNVFRQKLSYPDLKRAVIAQQAAFLPSIILIEDMASGTQLIQDLIEGGLSMVTRINPAGDKTMRLLAQTPTIENGFVLLPEQAHWKADYLHEMTQFPNGRYDDQVDSTVHAIAWTKLRPPGWAFWELARREAAERAGQR